MVIKMNIEVTPEPFEDIRIYQQFYNSLNHREKIDIFGFKPRETTNYKKLKEYYQRFKQQQILIDEKAKELKVNRLINSDWHDYIHNIPDNSIDLIFTDPPYNVSQKGVIFRDYRKNSGINGKKRSGDIKRDFGKWDYNYNPEEFIFHCIRVLNETGSILVFTSDKLIGKYQEVFDKYNLNFQKILCWIKTNPTPCFRKINYRSATEFILWSSKETITVDNPNWDFLKQEEMKNYFMFPVCSGKERTSHPTQKPLALCQEIIKRHSKAGGIILDPFSGVGSISLAAYSLGRKYIGIEIDEKYHKLAKKRFQGYKTQVEEHTDYFEQLKF